MTAKATTALKYIDEKRSYLTALADEIWDYAELALHEDRSAVALEKALEAEGFRVEVGVGGMPTAFVGTWGSGKPVLGFLGEYDALSGVSQKVQPTREPRVEGAPGHGCGHNLLGTGSYAAAIALKKEMEARGLSGTVKYFGCPAEENLSGKAFMARDGVFDGVDACLTWHAGQLNRVAGGSSLANNAMNITFRGKSAHAAGDPYNGRSALDAVQLMNLGVEFLREHMPPKARVHYVITNGGDQPNVVPAIAKVWYLVRAPQRHQVDELYERVLKCAEGAAIMTDTTYEIELLKAIWNVLPNPTLEHLVDECLDRVGPPQFTAADLEFAKEIQKSIGPKLIESSVEKAQLSREDLKVVKEQVLNTTIVRPPVTAKEPSGSTDVGDVSWCTPTVEFNTTCNAIGTPGHSWQYCAQAGMGIGHAGMIAAAKVMAEAAFELVTTPELLAKAKADFNELTGGRKYKSAMPPEQKPAFHQFA